MGEINTTQGQEVINTELAVKKQPKAAHLKPYQFKPGQSGNPNGKPPGTKSFDTIFEEAIKEIVKSKKLPIKDPEKELMIKGIIEALKGNHNFWKSISEWRYGKPKETIDIEGEVKTTQIKELVLTTRQILELKPDVSQSSDNTIGPKQIQE